ncbi:hypothetical protein LXL04_028680 [Taraxacum kok-saghyz]
MNRYCTHATATDLNRRLHPLAIPPPAVWLCDFIPITRGAVYTDSVEPAAAPMAASPFPAESRHKKPDIDQFAPEKATKNSAAAVEKGHNGGMGSRNVGKAADWRPKAEWKLVEGQYGLSISWKWMQKWRMSVAFLIVQLLEMHYGSVMRKSDYEGGMMLQILTIAETGYGISIGKNEQNLL